MGKPSVTKILARINRAELRERLNELQREAALITSLLRALDGKSDTDVLPTPPAPAPEEKDEQDAKDIARMLAHLKKNGPLFLPQLRDELGIDGRRIKRLVERPEFRNLNNKIHAAS